MVENYFLQKDFPLPTPPLLIRVNPSSSDVIESEPRRQWRNQTISVGGGGAQANFRPAGEFVFTFCKFFLISKLAEPRWLRLAVATPTGRRTLPVGDEVIFVCSLREARNELSFLISARRRPFTHRMRALHLPKVRRR